MVTVTASPNCGNAPRQAQVRDVLAAAARGERSVVELAVATDWEHRVAGRPPAFGDHATEELLAEMSPPGLKSIDFTTVISHGKFAMASGWLMGPGTQTEFCCVVTFSGHSNTARIATCVTYLAAM